MSQTLRSLVDYVATGKADSTVSAMLAEGDRTGEHLSHGYAQYGSSGQHTNL